MIKLNLHCKDNIFVRVCCWTIKTDATNILCLMITYRMRDLFIMFEPTCMIA